MPVFFIHSTQVEDERITITDPLFSHLSKSLRIRQGDHLILNDERGRRYHTTIVQITKILIHSKILGIQESSPSSTPRFILGQALLKGEKMGWVIQKATELGIDAIAPLITKRVIPQVCADNAATYQERWERIALEAAQQSERWTLPTIYPPQLFREFLERDKEGINIFLVERQKRVSLLNIPLPSGIQSRIAIIIGPEGGWTKEELQIAQQARNCTFATLGHGILRAETASLASLAILQARLHYL
jgi:16S rRNA (uracil1498-N3)-methyltransferase